MLKLVYSCVFVLSNVLDAESTLIKLIDLKPVNDYNVPLLHELDQGRPIDSFLGVSLEKDLVRENFCDFNAEFDPKNLDWGYIPSICVNNEDNCINPFPAPERPQETCAALAQAQNPGTRAFPVCCMINATKKYRELMPRQSVVDILHLARNIYEFKEVPNDFKLYEGFKHTVIAGRNIKFAKEQSLNAASSQEYAARLRKELVCGSKKGEQLKIQEPTPNGLKDIYNRVPFFCVRPEHCIASDDEERIPRSLWHEFCQNKVNPRLEHQGKTTCCHVDSISKDFITFDYVHLPELPLFLKYAPGLRSTFKCEEYAKKVCEGENSRCEPKNLEAPTPLQNPHMAVLGFTVPRFMLFFCGGSLVSRRYILSSATCASYFGYSTNVVLLGDYAISEVNIKAEKTYIISEILPYERSGFHLKEGEQPRSVYDQVDLALYKTDSDVELSASIRPACLYYRPLKWPQKLDFIGFGTSPIDNKRNEIFRTLELPFIARPRCEVSDNFFDERENPYYTTYGVKHDWMVCYGDKQNPWKAPCLYDTGGPLQAVLDRPYCSSQILGVLSSIRRDCSQAQPSVFINVTMFVEEIEDEIWGDYTFLDISESSLARPTCGEFRDLYFHFYV